MVCVCVSRASRSQTTVHTATVQRKEDGRTSTHTSKKKKRKRKRRWNWSRGRSCRFHRGGKHKVYSILAGGRVFVRNGSIFMRNGEGSRWPRGHKWVMDDVTISSLSFSRTSQLAIYVDTATNEQTDRTNSVSLLCLSVVRHGGGAVSGWRQPGGIASVQLTTDSINCVPSGGQREYKLATWNRLFCPKVRERSGGNQVGNRGKWPPIATRPCLATRSAILGFLRFNLDVVSGNEIHNERELAMFDRSEELGACW